MIAPPGEWAFAPWDTRAAILCCGLWLGGLWLLLRAAPDVVGRGLRRPLIRVFGAAGRLMADNLQRDRSRVTLTILTLAFGLLVLTGLTGFLKFFLSHDLHLDPPNGQRARHAVRQPRRTSPTAGKASSA